jgi:predicted nuclease of predicted toxin-antitoxin system
MSLRFHLDACVHRFHEVARALRDSGIDVTEPVQVGLRTAEDEGHRLFAISEGRVIVTCDEDFVVMAYQGLEHVGIVYWKNGTRSLNEIIEWLILMDTCYSHDDLNHDGIHELVFLPGIAKHSQADQEQQQNLDSNNLFDTFNIHAVLS